MRLDKLLSNLGLCSRKDTRKFLKIHTVLFNGEELEKPDTSVDPSQILIDGEAIIPPGTLTVVLNKPPGFTCSHTDKGRIIYELLPEHFSNRKPLLSSVGRLDKESSGLLILTDDGDLNHQLCSPKKNIPKKYHVSVRDTFNQKEKDLFASGTFTLAGESKPLLPVELTYIDDTTCTVSLYEGRNRQIRRMFEEIGNEVVALHRESIGNLTLNDLEEGDWKIASAEDIMLAQSST